MAVDDVAAHGNANGDGLLCATCPCRHADGRGFKGGQNLRGADGMHRDVAADGIRCVIGQADDPRLSPRGNLVQGDDRRNGDRGGIVIAVADIDLQRQCRAFDDGNDRPSPIRGDGQVAGHIQGGIADDRSRCNIGTAGIGIARNGINGGVEKVRRGIADGVEGQHDAHRSGRLNFACHVGKDGPFGARCNRRVAARNNAGAVDGGCIAAKDGVVGDDDVDRVGIGADHAFVIGDDEGSLRGIYRDIAGHIDGRIAERGLNAGPQIVARKQPAKACALGIAAFDGVGQNLGRIHKHVEVSFPPVCGIGEILDRQIDAGAGGLGDIDLVWIAFDLAPQVGVAVILLIQMRVFQRLFADVLVNGPRGAAADVPFQTDAIPRRQGVGPVKHTHAAVTDLDTVTQSDVFRAGIVSIGQPEEIGKSLNRLGHFAIAAGFGRQRDIGQNRPVVFGCDKQVTTCGDLCLDRVARHRVDDFRNRGTGGHVGRNDDARRNGRGTVTGIVTQFGFSIIGDDRQDLRDRQCRDGDIATGIDDRTFDTGHGLGPILGAKIGADQCIGDVVPDPCRFIADGVEGQRKVYRRSVRRDRAVVARQNVGAVICRDRNIIRRGDAAVRDQRLGLIEDQVGGDDAARGDALCCAVTLRFGLASQKRMDACSLQNSNRDRSRHDGGIVDLGQCTAAHVIADDQRANRRAALCGFFRVGKIVASAFDVKAFNHALFQRAKEGDGVAARFLARCDAGRKAKILKRAGRLGGFRHLIPFRRVTEISGGQVKGDRLRLDGGGVVDCWLALCKLVFTDVFEDLAFKIACQDEDGFVLFQRGCRHIRFVIGADLVLDLFPLGRVSEIDIRHCGQIEWIGLVSAQIDKDLARQGAGSGVLDGVMLFQRGVRVA